MLLLAGCGDGSGDTSASAPISVVPGAGAATPPPPLATTHPLNLALTLAYLGAQFYGFAAQGNGLPAALTSGVGQAGAANGARSATFDDAAGGAYAAELFADKQAHVVALRAQLGALAAAQPALDLSSGATGAFARVAQGAGIVPAGAAFDPYASSKTFLLGAFLLENTVAAAYRTLLAGTDDPATLTLLSANLADAIYHGGLIRALLDDKATTDASIATALQNASALLAGFDGSNLGDQTLAGATGMSANLIAADGVPIPFLRASQQVLRSLALSNSGVGGFLPAGANGVLV